MRILALILSLLLCTPLWGEFAHAEEPACRYCGMYRSMHAHSWVVITYENGGSSGVCSVHCAAIDIALHTDKSIRGITVGDFDTKRQIDAGAAYWIIGGDIMGVMTARAKWAFETKEAADNFLKIHGGRPANFDDVIKAAFEDMYQDTLLIRKKRKLINMRKIPSH